MHLAYQGAAKNMRGQSAVSRLQNRLSEEMERKSREGGMKIGRLFRCRLRLQIVEGDCLKGAIALLIFLNSVLIGVMSDMTMRSSFDIFCWALLTPHTLALHSWAIVLDYIFNAAFIVELAFRMLVLDGSFCGCPAWRSNLFDTLLVAVFDHRHDHAWIPFLCQCHAGASSRETLQISSCPSSDALRRPRSQALFDVSRDAQLHCDANVSRPGPDHSYFRLLRCLLGCRGPVRLRRGS